MNNKTQYEHFVPQMLLKHFPKTGKKGLYYFNKENDEIDYRNISNLGGENGFYDIFFENHLLSMESSLGEIEGKCEKVISKIVRDRTLRSLSLDETILLFSFVNLQRLRVLNVRNGIRQMSDLLTERIRKNFPNSKNIDDYKKMTDEQAKIMSLKTIEEDFKEHIKYFYDKDIVLFEATKYMDFYISDNPVTMCNPNDFGPRGKMGIAVKGIQIYMPLSNKLTLGLMCPSSYDDCLQAKQEIGEEQIRFLDDGSRKYKLASKIRDRDTLIEGIRSGKPIPCDPARVEFFNIQQVKYSSKYIYANDDQFDLAKAMINSDEIYRTNILRPTIS